MYLKYSHEPMIGWFLGHLTKRVKWPIAREFCAVHKLFTCQTSYQVPPVEWAETCLKWCWHGPDQVFLFFGLVWKPRWPPQAPFWKHIWNFFSSSIGRMELKLAWKDPEMVLTKCCYFSGGSEIQDGCHFEQTVLKFISSSTSGI